MYTDSSGGKGVVAWLKPVLGKRNQKDSRLSIQTGNSEWRKKWHSRCTHGQKHSLSSVNGAVAHKLKSEHTTY
jgi:hypothetical protein